MVRSITKLAQSLLRKRGWVSAVLQGLLITLSYVLCWLVHFEFSVPNLRLFALSCAVLLLIRLPLIRLFNLLHGWWALTDVSDALEIGKAVVSGSVVFLLSIRFIPNLHGVPVAVGLMELASTALILGGVRVASRVMAEAIHIRESDHRILVIGAGFAAQMLLRELKQVGESQIVGCVDDDASKLGMKRQGVKVLGSICKLPEIVKRLDVNEVLIAVPSATGAQMRRFVEICESASVPFRTVPALHDFIAGASALQLRNVKPEDLLGRSQVAIDLEPVRREICGRSVLVTGAAGSIGSELCRQALSFGPRELICVDHNETGMFYLEQELSRSPNAQAASFVVGDVGNVDRMRAVFKQRMVHTVFHAAAYKHVPMMEMNVVEAVRNNVFGLLTLTKVAESSGCKKLIMISSDKAVNPTSVMGCTKRVCELILAARPSPMICASVRFGNVLGSNGSVIPVFQKQLAENRALTVTHREMTRYFMTISEAVSLVLQAAVVGKSGDILVLDMGEPMRILELAHAVIRLAGRSPQNVPINFTGLRKGEKMYEELFYEEERVVSSPCPKVRRTQSAVHCWPELQQQLELLGSLLVHSDRDELRARLREIVPQFEFEEVPEKVLTTSAGAGTWGEQRRGLDAFAVSSSSPVNGSGFPN